MDLGAQPWEADYWLDGPSPHLTWAELNCNDGTDYPIHLRKTTAVVLSTEFEIIRLRAGNIPIKIGSGYRTESWNRKIGGSRKSQHVQATALDLHTPPDCALADFAEVVANRAQEPGSLIRGVGVYPWGVHFDVRPGDRVARWKGTRVRAEVWDRVIDTLNG